MTIGQLIEHLIVQFWKMLITTKMSAHEKKSFDFNLKNCCFFVD